MSARLWTGAGITGAAGAAAGAGLDALGVASALRDEIGREAAVCVDGAARLLAGRVGAARSVVLAAAGAVVAALSVDMSGTVTLHRPDGWLVGGGASITGSVVVVVAGAAGSACANSGVDEKAMAAASAVMAGRSGVFGLLICDQPSAGSIGRIFSDKMSRSVGELKKNRDMGHKILIL